MGKRTLQLHNDDISVLPSIITSPCDERVPYPNELIYTSCDNHIVLGTVVNCWHPLWYSKHTLVSRNLEKTMYECRHLLLHTASVLTFGASYLTIYIPCVWLVRSCEVVPLLPLHWYWTSRSDGRFAGEPRLGYCRLENLWKDGSSELTHVIIHVYIYIHTHTPSLIHTTHTHTQPCSMLQWLINSRVNSPRIRLDIGSQEQEAKQWSSAK